MKTILPIIMMFASLVGSTQPNDWQQYEPSEQHPFGQRNPKAAQQLDDFKPMIGICDCKSLIRNQDATLPDTVDMVWQFKYIMNGIAIQDQTWSEKKYATSIREFQTDSNLWVVGYSSFPGVSISPSTWLGRKEGDEIILKLRQKAPNGMDGISRLTFTNIRDEGFDWRGEWINEEKGIVYPFWLIWCSKRK